VRCGVLATPRWRRATAMAGWRRTAAPCLRRCAAGRWRHRRGLRPCLLARHRTLARHRSLARRRRGSGRWLTRRLELGAASAALGGRRGRRRRAVTTALDVPTAAFFWQRTTRTGRRRRCTATALEVTTTALFIGRAGTRRWRRRCAVAAALEVTATALLRGR